MTTAHNITADLRKALGLKAEALRMAMNDMDARPSHPDHNAKVLYADCGMVVTDGDLKTYRLGDTDNALNGAARFLASGPDAMLMADRWNKALTREQMTARCWVKVMSVRDALERAAEEVEALLEHIAKP